MPAILRLNPDVPRLLELYAMLGVGDVVKAGQLVGQRAHVTAALHVVLPAHRIAAAPVAANLAGQQRQIDERQYVVNGVVMLGDAERPADHSAVGSRVGVRGLANRLGRNASDLLSDVE